MLNVKALALAAGLLSAGCLFVTALLNLAFPSYAGEFLELAGSIYPGYDGPAGIGSAIVVALYAAVDGVIMGGLLAWLYNRFASPRTSER
jgi:membrane associated rhomboid family serine protease